jgi:hypothetical protein
MHTTSVNTWRLRKMCCHAFAITASLPPDQSPLSPMHAASAAARASVGLGNKCGVRRQAAGKTNTPKTNCTPPPNTNPCDILLQKHTLLPHLPHRLQHGQAWDLGTRDEEQTAGKAHTLETNNRCIPTFPPTLTTVPLLTKEHAPAASDAARAGLGLGDERGEADCREGSHTEDQKAPPSAMTSVRCRFGIGVSTSPSSSCWLSPA